MASEAEALLGTVQELRCPLRGGLEAGGSGRYAGVLEQISAILDVLPVELTPSDVPASRSEPTAMPFVCVVQHECGRINALLKVRD